MAVATFDTLKFANTLKAAGVPPQQAEAEAQAFAEVMQLNLKELVTKDDLATTAKDVKQEITDAKREAKQDSRELEQRLTAKLESLALQHKGDLQVLRWMVGAGMTVSIALLGIVVRLLVVRPGS